MGGDLCGCLLCVVLPSWCCEELPPELQSLSCLVPAWCSLTRVMQPNRGTLCGCTARCPTIGARMCDDGAYTPSSWIQSKLTPLVRSVSLLHGGLKRVRVASLVSSRS